MGKKTDPDIDFLMLDDTSYSKLSFILLNSSSEISPLTYLFFNILYTSSSFDSTTLLDFFSFCETNIVKIPI